MMLKVESKFVTIVLIGLVAVTLPINAASPGFSDQTANAGVTSTHAMPGDTPGLPMHAGGTVGDFNNDGWPDLLILGSGMAPDKLFINDQNNGFVDEAATWFDLPENQPLLYRGVGANAGDYNNDGWLDIFVTSMGDMPNAAEPGKHRLYHNNGDGTFSNVALAAGVNETAPYADGYGATFGDYDLDGDLDLWVGGWHLDTGDPFVGDAYGTRLFRNDGDGTFTEVSETNGVFTTKIRGFGAIFADTNGDRFPELLVAGDFGTSRYFANDRDGTFTSMNPLLPGGTAAFNGMGTTLADINRDGRMDWFVTAIYPASQDLGPPGNRLYVNREPNKFEALQDTSGINDGGWGWGAISVDYNHDGWVDIAHTNGWPNCDPVTGECFHDETSYLFENNKDETFTEVGAAYGMVHTLQGRCMMDLDYDRDGDRDFVILSNQDDLYLFRNDLTGTDANWLQIDLNSSDDPALAPDGWGANIYVTDSNGLQVARRNGGSNYLCGSEQVVHFGVGADAMVDVKVEWANGFSKTLDQVAVNQRITVAAVLPFVNTTAPVAGQDVTVVVSGLRAGETAHFGVSETGAGEGPCLSPTFGDLCVDLLSPIDLAGSAVADAAGTATLTFPIPLDAAGSSLFTQAVIARGASGFTSLKTNVVELIVP